MPWTRKPLTFTIDTKNSDEVAGVIARNLESATTGARNGQRNRRDVARNVSTANKKRRRPINPSQEKQETVFAFIQSHPGTRSTEIIAETSLSQGMVERCLAELRKQGRVEFVGSKKNGGYEAV